MVISSVWVIKKGAAAKQRFIQDIVALMVYILLYFAYSSGFAATPFPKYPKLQK